MHNIYFSSVNDKIEEGIIEKGWRGDILVEIDDLYYNPSVITIERLNREFNNALIKNQFYDIDNNIVLVQETSEDCIIKTLIYLINNNYFSNVKPVNLTTFLLDYDSALQNIGSWVKVWCEE